MSAMLQEGFMENFIHALIFKEGPTRTQCHAMLLLKIASEPL